MSRLNLIKYGLSPDITFEDKNFLSIVIENKKLLFSYASELYQNINGEQTDNSFNIYINNNLLSLSKSAITIFNFFNVDFNSKTVQTFLSKKLNEFLQSPSQFVNRSNLEANVVSILEDFRFEVDLNIDYESLISGAGISKLANLKIVDTFNDLLETITSYIDLFIVIKNVKLVVLLFGKEYLSESDFSNLHKFCMDRGCFLLNIENSVQNKYANERLYIIDNDLCVIQ